MSSSSYFEKWATVALLPTHLSACITGLGALPPRALGHWSAQHDDAERGGGRELEAHEQRALGHVQALRQQRHLPAGGGARVLTGVLAVLFSVLQGVLGRLGSLRVLNVRGEGLADA